VHSVGFAEAPQHIGMLGAPFLGRKRHICTECAHLLFQIKQGAAQFLRKKRALGNPTSQGVICAG